MRPLAVAAMLLSAAVVAGCGDDEDSDDGATPLSFEGTAPAGVHWELEAVEGDDGPCVKYRITDTSGSESSGGCGGLGRTCGAISVTSARGAAGSLIATGPTAASVSSVLITEAQGITGPSEEASLVRVSDEDAAGIGAKQGFGWFVASVPSDARRVSLVGEGTGGELLDWPIVLNSDSGESTCLN
jgi:hypothetical protein